MSFRTIPATLCGGPVIRKRRSCFQIRFVFGNTAFCATEHIGCISHLCSELSQGLAAILARFDVTDVDKGLACVPCTSHKKEWLWDANDSEKLCKWKQILVKTFPYSHWRNSKNSERWGDNTTMDAQRKWMRVASLSIMQHNFDVSKCSNWKPTSDTTRTSWTMFLESWRKDRAADYAVWQ